MARHERDFRSSSEQPPSLEELLAFLATVEQIDGVSREDAIACALSASEGWEEAVKRLGGAFADEGSKLKEPQDGLPRD